MPDPFQSEISKLSSSNSAGKHYDGATWQPKEYEVAYYRTLFQIADTSRTGKLSGQTAAEFLRKSQLSENTLQTIWVMVDTANLGYLEFPAFSKVMKLISVAQSKLPVSTDNLITETNLPKLVGLPGLASNDSLALFEPISQSEFDQYQKLFYSSGAVNNVLPQQIANAVLLKSQLGVDNIGKIWSAVNASKKSFISLTDFVLSMYLVKRLMNKHFSAVPANVPATLTQQVNKIVLLNSPKELTPVKEDPWEISRAEISKFETQFTNLDKDGNSFIPGDIAAAFFMKSRLPENDLAAIWDLSDTHNTGKLTKGEFISALALISRRLTGVEIPKVLPPNLQKIAAQTDSLSKKALSPNASVLSAGLMSRNSTFRSSDFASTTPAPESLSQKTPSIAVSADINSISYRRNAANASLVEAEKDLAEHSVALNALKSSLDNEYKLVADLEALLEGKTQDVNRVKSLVEAEKLKQGELQEKKSALLSQIAILDKGLLEIKDLYNYNLQHSAQLDNLAKEQSFKSFEMKSELEKEQGKLLQLQNEIESKKREFALLKKQNEALIKESADLSNGVLARTKEVEVLREQNISLQKEAESVSKETEVLNNETISLKTQLETLQTQATAVAKKIESRKNNAALIKEKNEALRKQNAVLIDEIESAKAAEPKPENVFDDVLRANKTISEVPTSHITAGVEKDASTRTTGALSAPDDSTSPFEPPFTNKPANVAEYNDAANSRSTKIDGNENDAIFSALFSSSSMSSETPLAKDERKLTTVSVPNAAEGLINTLPIAKTNTNPEALEKGRNDVSEVDTFMSILSSTSSPNPVQAQLPVETPQLNRSPFTSPHIQEQSTEEDLSKDDSTKLEERDNTSLHDGHPVPAKTPLITEPTPFSQAGSPNVLANNPTPTESDFDNIFSPRSEVTPPEINVGGTVSDNNACDKHQALSENHTSVDNPTEAFSQSSSNSPLNLPTGTALTLASNSEEAGHNSELPLKIPETEHKKDSTLENDSSINEFTSRFPEIESIGKVIDDESALNNIANLKISESQEPIKANLEFHALQSPPPVPQKDVPKALEGTKNDAFNSIFQTPVDPFANPSASVADSEPTYLRSELNINDVSSESFVDTTASENTKSLNFAGSNLESRMTSKLQTDHINSDQSQGLADKNLKSAFDSLFDNLAAKADSVPIQLEPSSQVSNISAIEIQHPLSSFYSKPLYESSEPSKFAVLTAEINNFKSLEKPVSVANNDFDAFMTIAKSTPPLDYSKIQDLSNAFPPVFSSNDLTSSQKDDPFSNIFGSGEEPTTSSQINNFSGRGLSSPKSQSQSLAAFKDADSELSRSVSGASNRNMQKPNTLSKNSSTKAKSFYNIDPEKTSLHSGNQPPIPNTSTDFIKVNNSWDIPEASKPSNQKKSAEKSQKDRKSRFGLPSFMKRSSAKNNRKTMGPTTLSSTVGPRSNQIGPVSNFQQAGNEFSTYRGTPPLNPILELDLGNELDSGDEDILKAKGWRSSPEKVKMFIQLKSMGFTPIKIVDALETCGFDFSQVMEYLVIME